jgi:hypothetical protein
MDTDVLRRTYAANPAVKAVCDHLASRDRNQNETKLHRILMHLEQEGAEFRKAEVIAAFRALEAADCGKYVEGRHGWKSRFVWSVNSKHLAAVAAGADAAEAEHEEVEDSGGDGSSELLEHTYWLRPDVSVSIELPADITQREAYRLSQFIDSLSFEE